MNKTGCAGFFMSTGKATHPPAEGFSIKKDEFSGVTERDVYIVHPDLAYTQTEPVSPTLQWGLQGGSVSVFGLYGPDTGHNINPASELVPTAFWQLAQHENSARFAAQMKFADKVGAAQGGNLVGRC